MFWINEMGIRESMAGARVIVLLLQHFTDNLRLESTKERDQREVFFSDNSNKLW